MRAWQAALSRRVAKSTARTIRGVVGAILRSAVVDRVISSSPLEGVPMPAKPDRVLVRPYSAERVRGLRYAITPRYAAAIIVGAGLGLRRGEAFGLTVDRVDFLRREVTVDRQLVGVRDGRPVFGPPKTAASVRVIPAPQSVLDALAAHLARFPATPGAGVYVEGDGADRPVTHDGLIFTAPRGGPVLRGKVGEAWRDAEVRLWARQSSRPLERDGFRIPAAVLDAYLEAHPDGHGHRFHELRHFYASTLIASGASVKVVQARLGHATAAETLDTYSHLWPDDDDRTRAALDAVFGDDQGDDGAVSILTGV
jgi:integrase